VLVDRTSIEIFGNDGRVYLPLGAVLDPGNRSLSVSARGGEARIERLELFELRSVWEEE
jgi:sucrose-6-phosphate hydrolase SacC (GH32 family)